jgi:hypothetical protein
MEIIVFRSLSTKRYPIVRTSIIIFFLLSFVTVALAGSDNRFLINAGVGAGGESYWIRTSSVDYPDLNRNNFRNDVAYCARFGIGVRVGSVPLMLENNMTWFKMDDTTWRLSGFHGIGSFYDFKNLPIGISGAIGFDYQPLLIDWRAIGFGAMVSPYYDVTPWFSLSLDIVYGYALRHDKVWDAALNDNVRIFFGKQIDFTNLCQHVSVSLKANVKHW